MTAPVDVTIDGRFMPWLNEHFEMVPFDPFPQQLRCRRCAELVTWPTKHAAERHGDNVLVVIGGEADPVLQLW